MLFILAEISKTFSRGDVFQKIYLLIDFRGIEGKKGGEGGGDDHVYQEKIEPKKEEMIGFAKRVADYCDNARKANNLNKLIIVAAPAPAFLGELRN